MNKYTPPESIRPLLEKHPAIFRFRRALRRADQVALDHILDLACSSAPAYTLIEHLLLAMLLAEQEQLGQLKDLISRSSLPSAPPEG